MGVRARSYSRWNTYDGCPAKFKYKFFDKLPDEGGPALERGEVIHKKGENFLKGSVETSPEEFEKFQARLYELRVLNAAAEETWTFDNDWNVVELFSKKAAWRIKTDSHVIIPEKKLCRVVDFKTGKLKNGGYDAQMELYALGAFFKYAGLVETVQTELWFLDHDQGVLPPNPVQNRFGLWQRDVLLATWERRTAPMMSDTTFAPTPSNFCRWCPYSKAKGGPCQF